MTKAVISILLLANGIIAVHNIYYEHKLDSIIAEIVERQRIELLTNINSYIFETGGPRKEKALLFLISAGTMNEDFPVRLINIDKEALSKDQVNYLKSLKPWKRANEAMKQLKYFWCWRRDGLDPTMLSIATRDMNSGKCKEVKPILITDVEGVYIDAHGKLVYRNNQGELELDQLQILEDSFQLFRLTGEEIRINVEYKNEWCYYH